MPTLQVSREKEVSRKAASKSSRSKKLPAPLLLQIHELMLKTRVLEERLIKMYKQNDGYFWIGGPGEEAFNIPLGLQLRRGQGPKFDYFHGHYRSSGVLVAMGANPLDTIRQMKNTVNDPYSGGRNFVNHQSIREWNVAPISSPIEVQYAMAPGTALANLRCSKDALTVVIGGDAGTAEGDFASCLVWSSRPGQELPILIIVTNNHWGISTPAKTQHGESRIADRGNAFGIKTMLVNGFDPIESYVKIGEAMEYIRRHRKPVLMEAYVSRLYGHSSASGANFVGNERDPIREFEKKLIADKVLKASDAKGLWESYNQQMLEFAQGVRNEPQPSGDSIWDFVFANQRGRTERYW
jgi:2-oxoisovalerate dehydrogenase E1 component alpha subunit